MHWTTSRLFLSPEENQGHVNVLANMKTSILLYTLHTSIQDVH